MSIVHRMSIPVEFTSLSLSSMELKEKKRHANKVPPVCVNQGRSLHLVQAPGKPPPSNEEEGHKWGSGGF